jgi:hypothetical protein
MLWIFIALKNPSLSAGFEPANLGSICKHDNYYTAENDKVDLIASLVHLIITTVIATLGGLVVACLTLDPRFAGSNPAEDDEIFKDDKNP